MQRQIQVYNPLYIQHTPLLACSLQNVTQVLRVLECPHMHSLYTNNLNIHIGSNLTTMYQITSLSDKHNSGFIVRITTTHVCLFAKILRECTSPFFNSIQSSDGFLQRFLVREKEIIHNRLAKCIIVPVHNLFDSIL